MIDLKQLTKQQQQYILLGIIGAVILTVLFATVFKKDKKATATAGKPQQIEELNKKIETAKNAIRTLQNKKTTCGEMPEFFDQCIRNIPPHNNPYAWATEYVYSRKLEGLEIDSVEQVTRPVINPDGLSSYCVRIIGKSSFETMHRFIRILEEGNPMIRIRKISVSAGSDPTMQQIQIEIEWPLFALPEGDKA